MSRRTAEESNEGNENNEDNEANETVATGNGDEGNENNDGCHARDYPPTSVTFLRFHRATVAKLRTSAMGRGCVKTPESMNCNTVL